MLRQFFARPQAQTTPPPADPTTEKIPAIIRTPAPARQQTRRAAARRKREITWYGYLAVLILILLGLCALGLFAYQTWEFVSWLFPSESFGYRILALVNFDVFSTVWLCLHLFVYLQPGAKKASQIAGTIDLILSLVCTVIELMRQASQQLIGMYNPDPNMIASGMAIVVIALLVNFLSLLAVLYSQWPVISGQVEVEEEVYSPVETQVQPVHSPVQQSPEMELVKMMFQLIQNQQGGMQPAQLPLAPPKSRAGATDATKQTKKSLPKRASTN